MTLRSVIVTGLRIGLAAILGMVLSGTTAHAAPPAPPSASRVAGPLDRFVELEARRVRIADQVAAAKWASGAPVSDPAREKIVLDRVARKAAGLGLDPAVATRIFRDQIEASKLVQRAVHRYWRLNPANAPKHPPALDDVRPAIDRVDGALLRELTHVARIRHRPLCEARLGIAFGRNAGEADLDWVHQAGLGLALDSVCEPQVEWVRVEAAV